MYYFQVDVRVQSSFEMVVRLLLHKMHGSYKVHAVFAEYIFENNNISSCFASYVCIKYNYKIVGMTKRQIFWNAIKIYKRCNCKRNANIGYFCVPP